MNIQFKNFPVSQKREIATLLCKLFSNARINHSYELGIELPLTPMWIDTIKITRYNDILQYHNARQLRFIEKDGMIIGMRSKDDMPYFTKEELDLVKNYLYYI